MGSESVLDNAEARCTLCHVGLHPKGKARHSRPTEMSRSATTHTVAVPQLSHQPRRGSTRFQRCSAEARAQCRAVPPSPRCQGLIANITHVQCAAASKHTAKTLPHRLDVLLPRHVWILNTDVVWNVAFLDALPPARSSSSRPQHLGEQPLSTRTYTRYPLVVVGSSVASSPSSSSSSPIKSSSPPSSSK